MLRVALTGGVGSGKSTVAAMLVRMGAHLSQSDEVARTLMRPGGAAYAPIVQTFGQGVVREDGYLDRSALARLAFDEERVEDLNNIVHPLVIAAQAQWAADVAQQYPDAVAVIESALVFETKTPWRDRFDRILVVTAPVELRRQRFLARSLSADDFDRRAAAQWSDARKAALADFVIANNGSLQDLEARTHDVWQELKQESITRNS